MISVDDALDRIFARIPVPAFETVPLSRAHRSILEAAETAGLGALDNSAIIRVLAARTGSPPAKVRCPVSSSRPTCVVPAIMRSISAADHGRSKQASCTAAMASASASFVASGFSHSTCFPAARKGSVVG